MNTLLDAFISPISALIENKFILFLIVGLFAISSLFFIKYKAKSGFSLSDRFWVFWTGHKCERSGDLLSEIIEIEKFNYHYNTYAISKKQTAQLESWVRKYELDFKLIAKLKRNLKIDTLKIKKVNKAIPPSIFMFLFVPFFAFLGAFVIAIKPAGLIKIDGTGWFWFNANEAMEYSFLGRSENSWIIKKEQCTKKNEIKVNLDNITIDTICDSFNSQRVSYFIKSLIKKQRWFFGISSGVLLFIAGFLFRETISLLITYDAREMIYLKIKKYRSNRESKRHKS
ncbi:hypothetical protein EH228_19275 [Erwinia endophytica]|uniref:DUF6216 family protein n=1 Tax=Erwinia endophytica TaxID=1563158 RepID=UPI00126603FA|nr:DUF6216 family protein [Erwinia endophytica]KAB8305223.1 hypothetical protein EH228_19275 [Erwinia endophytica]